MNGDMTSCIKKVDIIIKPNKMHYKQSSLDALKHK